MEWIATLGRTMGFSFAAGINLYATVAILGLASRYNWVTLPSQYQAFDNDFIIATALTLYVIEFVADKIPWFDSIWDTVHTAIRPLGGAVIAVTTLGEATPTTEVLVGLLGGALAAGTHFTKAGTRAMANTSPEPFSNWILSLGEDAFVIGLGVVALKYPVIAAGVVIVGVIFIALFATDPLQGNPQTLATAEAAHPLPPSTEGKRPRLQELAIQRGDPLHELDSYLLERLKRFGKLDLDRVGGVDVGRREHRRGRRCRATLARDIGDAHAIANGPGIHVHRELDAHGGRSDRRRCRQGSAH